MDSPLARPENSLEGGFTDKTHLVKTNSHGLPKDHYISKRRYTELPAVGEMIEDDNDSSGGQWTDNMGLEV